MAGTHRLAGGRFSGVAGHCPGAAALGAGRTSHALRRGHPPVLRLAAVQRGRVHPFTLDARSLPNRDGRLDIPGVRRHRLYRAGRVCPVRDGTCGPALPVAAEPGPDRRAVYRPDAGCLAGLALLQPVWPQRHHHGFLGRPASGADVALSGGGQRPLPLRGVGGIGGDVRHQGNGVLRCRGPGRAGLPVSDTPMGPIAVPACPAAGPGRPRWILPADCHPDPASMVSVGSLVSGLRRPGPDQSRRRVDRHHGGAGMGRVHAALARGQRWALGGRPFGGRGGVGAGLDYYLPPTGPQPMGPQPMGPQPMGPQRAAGAGGVPDCPVGRGDFCPVPPGGARPGPGQPFLGGRPGRGRPAADRGGGVAASVPPAVAASGPASGAGHLRGRGLRYPGDSLGQRQRRGQRPAAVGCCRGKRG